MAKHKLLLADDSITIQKVVNLTFADEGIEVISVGDGNSAMEKFSEFTPDLVMADINMPGLSGYEICERIRQNEATRRIPVILLVGSFEPFDEAEAQRVGANDYLKKPFQSIRQLVTKVSDLLNSSSDSEENQEETQPPSSFDDTLRMNEPVPESEELGDAGMDDDMINAYQVGSSVYDETGRFESQPETESGDYGKTQPLSADELSEIHSYQNQEATDLSGRQIYGFTGETENRGQDYADEEMDSDEADTRDFSADKTELSAQTYEPQPASAFESSPELELDEANLLELPPRQSFSPHVPPVFDDSFASPAVEPVDETGETAREDTVDVADETVGQETVDAFDGSPQEEDFETEVEAPQTETFDAADETQPEESVETEETSEAETNELETSETGTGETEASEVETGEADISEEISASEASAVPSEGLRMTNLSPEIIDQIAAKVVEKISDKVIREIAWEVVPQMTDLIVKRLAEEKLKE